MTGVVAQSEDYYLDWDPGEAERSRRYSLIGNSALYCASVRQVLHQVYRLTENRQMMST